MGEVKHFESNKLSIPQIQPFWNLNLNTPKSNVKVIGEVKVQGYIVDPTSYWFSFISLHVNQPSHSKDKRSMSRVNRQQSGTKPKFVAKILATNFSNHLCMDYQN